MRNIRYFIRLTLAFINKFKGLILVGALIGIIFFFSAQVIVNLLFSKSTEKIGITGRFNAGNLPAFILEQISDGLTKIDDDGTVLPSLAESWLSSDKGKTWVFTLKENSYWQNGGRVTSENIVYEYSDVIITRPDDKTIIFELKDIFSPFPSVVSKPTFRKGLLGTGDWTVDDITISGSYIQKLTLSDKNKNKIIYKFYPTEERAKLAYKLGEIDSIKNIFVASPLDKWGTAVISEKDDSNKVVTIFFNNQDKYLSEKVLRQALIYAIDKTSLGGKRAVSPISSNSWAFNPQVKKYNYDVGRAKDLLDELPEEHLNDVNIKLVSSPFLVNTADEIAKFWAEIGIETSVLVSSIIPGEFQAYLTVLDAPVDPDQYFIWHSTQVDSNISRYSSPRIDKLLEDGRTELSFEERRKIYLDFQRFLVEDSPAAFLYTPKAISITRK